MGKQKINNMVKINDNAKRHLSFYKRSRGVAIKLLELHNLCGAKVFSIILSETEKMTVVTAGSTSSDLIKKYNSIEKKNSRKLLMKKTMVFLSPY